MLSVTRRDVIIFVLALTLFYVTWPTFFRGETSNYPQNPRPPSFFNNVASGFAKIPISEPKKPSERETSPSPCNFHLILKSMINFPEWYRNNYWGLTKDKQTKFDKALAHGNDKEEETAWDNFFYQATQGLMLEMGGMDGKLRSVSHMFEYGLNWRTILIEANPLMAAKLSENRPNALNFNLAICDSEKTVHYISHATRDEVNGIVEFLSPGFFKTIFPELLLSNGAPDWEKIKKDPRVKEIPCVPLMSVLAPLGITHINFFLLDVENGELSVLKAIDFDKIKFDVISIETNRGVDNLADTEKYIDSILELLTSKGYVVWNRKLGPNTWVTHPDFVPYKKT